MISDDASKLTVVGIGPNMAALEQVASKAERLETTAVVMGLTKEMKMQLIYSADRPGWISIKSADGFKKYTRTVGAGLVDLAARGKQLMLESITVKGSKSPVGGKDLRRLAIAAWCEAADVPVPSQEEMEQLLCIKPPKSEPKGHARKLIIEQLRSAQSAVQLLNGLTPDQLKEIKHFKNVDFSGLTLNSASFWNLDCEGANFAKADLSRADLNSCVLRAASFEGCTLIKADLSGAKACDADFSGADLTETVLHCADLRDALFSSARLHKAQLRRADLRGADLSSADLSDAVFQDSCMDDKTRLPQGFDYPLGMKWMGSGVDPNLLLQVKAQAAQYGALDFESFLNKLKQNFDGERVKKALKMLQAESFQLFSELKNDSLVGIVKSQTDPDLVYSCRLTQMGNFSCCTQNLFPCGGLRGSLCKHLLVLLVGLTRAGELDATTACEWILASGRQKPAMDKDSASETFLRYKGAEAGEIDWRPTETMPEDYYAF